MRIRLKNYNTWATMPIADFVLQMRKIIRADPLILTDPMFGRLLRERQDEIIAYHWPDR